MEKNWFFTESDRKLAAELNDFVPSAVYDAHLHVYTKDDLKHAKIGLIEDGPYDCGVEAVKAHMADFMPQSVFDGGILMPFPTFGGDMDKVNDYLVAELDKSKMSRGLIGIKPDYPEDRVRYYLENPQIKGFKPYHVFSKSKPTWHSSLEGFLPEWVWKIADENGLLIMLHMVKDLAVADPQNQAEIRSMCLKYPQAKLILAHAARCFHAPNAKKGLKSLRGLENIWFDMSGICEAEPIKEIIYEFGPDRLMWGSDFPVCMIRGRAVTVGLDFLWIQDDTVCWDHLPTSCTPVLVGLESLRALKIATEDMGLNRRDIEKIFRENAIELAGAKVKITANTTQELYVHGKSIIPGGTQLLSKRPELMAPGQWPAYYREARGCETWDLDGKHYYDMSTNGIGACLLGFRDPDVTRAVIRRINLGSMCSLNPPEEVELGDRLIELHPWAKQVRFARGGGDACAVAVRIARATTDRSLVAICGYHGWHDWYLAANLGDRDELRGHLLPGLVPDGVPTELRGSAVTFRYNDWYGFDEIIKNYGSRLAAVIMEPCRNGNPEPGFLEHVRSLAHKTGALLIFDEVSIGWRLHYGGAHMKFAVHPDIAVFAKALGNGHPIGAVIGTQEAMEGAHTSFISSTYWTEGVGPAAALAVLDIMSRNDVPAYIDRVGSRIMSIWRKHAERHGLNEIVVSGYPCLAHFSFDHPKSDVLRTLFTQMMLERGFLAGPSIYVTMAHSDEVVALYDQAVDEVFAAIAAILRNGDINMHLKGDIAMSGFRRLI
jgi:glutamate-1-semialdehyde 2,1-aminomutase